VLLIYLLFKFYILTNHLCGYRLHLYIEIRLRDYHIESPAWCNRIYHLGMFYRPDPAAPKYLRVYAALRRNIESGRWKEGEQLPSELDLVRTFGVSRITVTRAVRDLVQAGLVERHAGSGTFVRCRRTPAGRSFGLLIPDLGETEIFEPICQGMMASPLARECALLWGGAVTEGASKEACAWSLCRQFVGRGVAGVFFAPLELTESSDLVNERILRALDEARIPVVLLDRPAEKYPATTRHDLVGIDNRRAGHVMTDYLLSLGCRRVGFVALPNAAVTVDEREAGYREALYAGGVSLVAGSTRRINPEDVAAVSELVESTRPDGLLCANDRTAGRLMHTLRQLRYRIPGDIRLVGIDDVEYARLLPVPLTTLRQPTRQMGDAALSLMLERISRRALPPRELRLGCELIVRESCGAA
jgi:GntR family transcriptional regulator, arabinose operon transcriptional repressor